MSLGGGLPPSHLELLLGVEQLAAPLSDPLDGAACLMHTAKEAGSSGGAAEPDASANGWPSKPPLSEPAQHDGTVSSGPARTSARSMPARHGKGRGNKSRKSAARSQLVCKVDGCTTVLSSSKAYYQRHRVCAAHLAAMAAPVDGVDSRFCQQCGKFQPVHELDSDKRSCRIRLKRHNNRRREQRHNKGGSSSSCAFSHLARPAAGGTSGSDGTASGSVPLSLLARPSLLPGEGLSPKPSGGTGDSGTGCSQSEGTIGGAAAASGSPVSGLPRAAMLAAAVGGLATPTSASKAASAAQQQAQTRPLRRSSAMKAIEALRSLNASSFASTESEFDGEAEAGVRSPLPGRHRAAASRQAVAATAVQQQQQQQLLLQQQQLLLQQQYQLQQAALSMGAVGASPVLAGQVQLGQMPPLLGHGLSHLNPGARAAQLQQWELQVAAAAAAQEQQQEWELQQQHWPARMQQAAQPQQQRWGTAFTGAEAAVLAASAACFDAAGVSGSGSVALQRSAPLLLLGDVAAAGARSGGSAGSTGVHQLLPQAWSMPPFAAANGGAGEYVAAVNSAQRQHPSDPGQRLAHLELQGPQGSSCARRALQLAGCDDFGGGPPLQLLSGAHALPQVQLSPRSSATAAAMVDAAAAAGVLRPGATRHLSLPGAQDSLPVRPCPPPRLSGGGRCEAQLLGRLSDGIQPAVADASCSAAGSLGGCSSLGGDLAGITLASSGGGCWPLPLQQQQQQQQALGQQPVLAQHDDGACEGASNPSAEVLKAWLEQIDSPAGSTAQPLQLPPCCLPLLEHFPGTAGEAGSQQGGVPATTAAAGAARLAATLAECAAAPDACPYGADDATGTTDEEDFSELLDLLLDAQEAQQDDPALRAAVL